MLPDALRMKRRGVHSEVSKLAILPLQINRRVAVKALAAVVIESGEPVAGIAQSLLNGFHSMSFRGGLVSVVLVLMLRQRNPRFASVDTLGAIVEALPLGVVIFGHVMSLHCSDVERGRQSGLHNQNQVRVWGLGKLNSRAVIAIALGQRSSLFS